MGVFVRQDFESCVVFSDASEGFLGILPEPPEHSHPVGFLLLLSVLRPTSFGLGRVEFVAVCPIDRCTYGWGVPERADRSQQGSALRVIPRIALSSTILGGPLSRDGLALSASHILPGTSAT